MGISIEISAGYFARNSSIKVTGSMDHVITDTEIQSFGLNQAALKNAVKANFGKKPSDAYLRSPTKWGDLYTSYGWKQVTCTLTPRSAYITGLSSESTIVATRTLRNKSDHTGTFTASIEETVEDTITSGWSNEKEVSFTQGVTYSAKVLGVGAEGSTTFGVTTSFGQSGETSTTHTVGSSSSVQVELEPGQSVKASLTCSKGLLRARVTYEAVLSGYTALNYSSEYKDHHFWGLDIGGVMESGGIQNSIQIDQDLVVGYYSEGTVTLDNHDGSSDRSFELPSTDINPTALWAN